MDLLYSIVLSVLHVFWSVCSVIASSWYTFFGSPPSPLNSSRKQLPSHIAIVFASAQQSGDRDIDEMVESITNAAVWCREIGIPHLSFFRKDDSLLRNIERIRAAITLEPSYIASSANDSSDSELEYPLTPPSSESSRSRSLSPDHSLKQQALYSVLLSLPSRTRASSTRKSTVKRRKRSEEYGYSQRSVVSEPSSISLFSYNASKPCLGTIAQRAFHECDGNFSSGFRLTLPQVNQFMEDMIQLPAPDLLLIHSLDSHHSLELHGFPPWLMRLSEIYCEPKPMYTLTKRRSLSEITFRRALDEYNSAEMRLGK